MINAARGSFTDALSAWNGLTPFLVKLRRYAGEQLPTPERFLDEVAGPLSPIAPDGWAHRALSSGNALLFIDGVDELLANERRRVRAWISGIIAAYPEVVILITSRPAAALPGWLSAENFAVAMLQPMSASDIKQLIAHWHTAIRASPELPCHVNELPTYERALVNRLEANPHLQGLAENPLLCAMLCALNLDRHTAVPDDRISVYRAAVDMLLHRRDFERDVPDAVALQIDLRVKRELVQDLAWKFSLNNRSEWSRTEVVERLRRRMQSVRIPSPVSAEELLESLVDRSGILREPTVGRIDFVHRTFQEYLAACEIAEQGDAGYLVERGHLDTWRETIILAAGHANVPMRQQLLDGLLDRAARDSRHGRSLKLLAAGCLETVGAIDPELRERVEGTLARLLPPRRLEEARFLATAGEILLARLPENLDGYSRVALQATIQAIGLIGGPKALEKLSLLADSSDSTVRSFIEDEGRNFEPVDFATAVLSKLDYNILPPFIFNRDQLAAWRFVKDLKKIEYCALDQVNDLKVDMRGLPPISRLWLSGDISDLRPLGRNASGLTDLTIWSDKDFRSLDPLKRAANLTSLILSQESSFESLDHLSWFPGLRQLWLLGAESIGDYSPLLELRQLEMLRLYAPPPPHLLKGLSGLVGLRTFGLGDSEIPGGLAALAQALPGLTSVEFFNASWLTDLDPLGAFDKLENFTLDGRGGTVPLGPLKNLKNLHTLDINYNRCDDLGVVAAMAGIQQLYLRECGPDVDLSPFRDKQIALYVNNPVAARRWAKKLGRGVKVIAI